jgi:hypothetical protein
MYSPRNPTWNNACSSAGQREGGLGSTARRQKPVAEMMSRRPPKARLAARIAGPSPEVDARDTKGLRVLLPRKLERKASRLRSIAGGAGGVHRSLKSMPSSSTFEVIPSTSNLPTRQSQGSVTPPLLISCFSSSDSSTERSKFS